jgi:glutathione peroxidase
MLPDIKLTTIDDNVISLSDYTSKTIIIVNTASNCGFTPQYEGLEKLYRKYKDKGLVILAFPCNQFMSQEPGTNKQILSFCTDNYSISFPVFSKIDVNGENKHPLYKWLTDDLPDQTKKIEWNFVKFIIDKNGKKNGPYSPTLTPEQLDYILPSLL